MSGKATAAPYVGCFLCPANFCRRIKATHIEDYDPRTEAWYRDPIQAKMDGFEMVQKLRQSPAFKDAIIIPSSASVFSFDRQRSREAGCNDFLPKPVQASDLFDQLQHYLQLTWIYETENQLTSKAPPAVQAESMIVPPSEELVALCQAAQAEYILDIQQEANRLKQLDPKYIVFADKVLKLAEQFNDEAIVNLVKIHLI